jgi:hypothetical protein
MHVSGAGGMWCVMPCKPRPAALQLPSLRLAIVQYAIERSYVLMISLRGTAGVTVTANKEERRGHGPNQ